MKSRTELVTLCTDKWNRDSQTYVPFKESRVMAKITKRTILDVRGRRFDPVTGRLRGYFYPGQTYRLSVRIQKEETA